MERMKPLAFSPLNVEPDARDKFTGPWPDLPCARGVVTVGLQYHQMYNILLPLYAPNASLVGLAGMRAREVTDAAI